MKIFILMKDEVTLKAVSEDEDIMLQYIVQQGLNIADYGYTKIKGDLANKILIDHDDLYLLHDDELDMIFTRSEYEIVTMTIRTEKCRIRTTLSDLEHFVRNYNLPEKDKLIIAKAYKAISSNIESRKISKIIRLDKFVDFVTRCENIADVFRLKQ